MERLREICDKLVAEKGDNFKKRLEEEFKEIDAQNEHGYFLDLYDKKLKYEYNENNLLVPFLLGIVSDFDIDQPPKTFFGDFPDVDVDFIPPVRDYLKNEWAPKTFGRDKVCSIGSYNTFGIKSAFINMARVFGKSRSEILDLTTQLSLKDDDGKPLSWDKAMELYPALKKYCEDNPEVADAAKKLLNRNNSMGKHAGGLIISSVPIDEFVPLVKDKEGTPLSAWVEGLHGQDLGPMGLVKFDLLVLTNLMQIALACRLVKERHGLESICALPGQSDWSDESYLNDPKALAMADKGDLKCIFQFDSDGIRKMVKEGGVNGFEDLVAFTSIYRPSLMQSGMHNTYIKRKRGEEDYEIHPLLEPILSKTLGCYIYQESIMRILHVVGDIPLKDCEIIRKAISKKKIEVFAEYKDRFIVNGQKNLGWEEKAVKELFDQVEQWSGYGFNRSHALAYTVTSGKLLYLKVHYPIEFYTAVLSCEEATEKIKEYKLEVSRHNIEMMPVDINKSGVKFQIVDNKIYFGFSNIKGIGEAIAQKIVDNQPYVDFIDFLMRFGTDNSVVKPLIGLRCFEGDPILLYKQYEWFKDLKNKREASRKRFETGQTDKLEQLANLLPPDWQELANFEPESLAKTEEMYREAVQMAIQGEEVFPTILLFIEPWQDEDGKVYDNMEEVRKLHKRYNKSIENRMKPKEQKEFDPEVAIDEKLAKIYSSQEESEKTFYGFLWTHPLEKNKNYSGLTFESYRLDELQVGPVEVCINKVEEKESKNKKVTYHLLEVEDANSEIQQIQVWQDDWERFGEDLQAGNMVRVRIKAPEGGFRRYLLDSPPRHKRHLLPKSKSMDARVVIL